MADQDDFQQPEEGYDYDDDDDDFEDDGEQRESTYSFSPEDVIAVARCVYPFEGTCDVELTLNDGDLINITRMDVGGGWWEGELNGQHGLFPESYVQLESETTTTNTEYDNTDQLQEQEDSSVRDSRDYLEPAQQTVRDSSVPPGAPFIGSGHKWHDGNNHVVITVKKSEQKGSKFSGVKKFTVYEIKSSTTVTRRYKHFAWLHDRLEEMFPCINIPPIPTKQVQGRFVDDFIESRRRKLERFLNRVNLHPVMGASSVFRHFLTASDQKEWKTGKRQAEADSSDSHFLSTVVVSDTLPSDYGDLLTCYKKFSTWYSKSLNALESSFDTLGKCNHATVDCLKKLSTNFKKFGDPSLFTESHREDYQPWWEAEDSVKDMLNSLGIVGEGVSQIANLLEEETENEKLGIVGFVKEYTALLKSFQTVFKTLDHKWQEQQTALTKETVPADVQDQLTRNCEMATAVVLAEIRQFYENAGKDLCAAMNMHFQSKLDFTAKVVEIWGKLQQEFPETQ
eukprot:m.97479 g.97479  ORF g.97479 m.97479 type:complete len:510 (-) comp8987_c0_seq1:3035-4564(-)